MIRPGDPIYDAHDLYAVQCPDGARFAQSIDPAFAADRARWADETALNLHGHACRQSGRHMVVTAHVSAWCAVAGGVGVDVSRASKGGHDGDSRSRAESCIRVAVSGDER